MMFDMKRKYFAFYFLIFLINSGISQELNSRVVKLNLINSSQTKQKSNLLLVKEANRRFELPDSLRKYDHLIYKNELRYHLVDLNEKIEDYWGEIPILLCYDNDRIILSLDTNHDDSFKGEEFFMSNNLDSTFSMEFNFEHKYDDNRDISIPVNLKVIFFERSVKLNIQYSVFLSSDEIQFDEKRSCINVFPYTAMARYELRNIETKRSEIYFKDELIDVNGIYWQIDSFDYSSKSLWIDSVGVVEKPIGYRVGQYIDKEFLEKSIESLNIFQTPINLMKDFTIFHFWGDWCQPCLEEIPRLKRLLSRVDSGKVNVVHLNFLAEKSNRNRALEFTNSLRLQGMHLLDDSFSDYSLVNFFNITSYPNYVIIDENFKIIYRSSDSDMNLPTFLKLQEIL